MKIISILFLLFFLNANSATTFLEMENAYRFNNLGVALLEQYKYDEAAAEFRRSLEIAPKLTMAQFNLAVAELNLQDLESARTEAEQTLRLSPELPQAHYLLGLIAKNQNKTAEAVERFRKVLAFDPNDVGANVNLGQILSQEKKYAEAEGYFRTAYRAEPYNTTAIYNLALTVQRNGDRDAAKKLLEDFQNLRETGAGTVIGQNYLEQGRYAEAISSTGAEAKLVDRKTPDVSFTADPNLIKSGLSQTKLNFDQTFLGKPLPADRKLFDKYYTGASVLLDTDNDGRSELFVADADRQVLLKKGKSGDFEPLDAGDLSQTGKAARRAAVAGDIDNDGLTDVFVLEGNQPKLYKNVGDNKFKDITAAAKIPAYPFLSISCALTDADHDGDLDIFIAGLADLSKPPKNKKAVFPNDFPPAPNQLLRNNGDGTFTDISAEAKIKTPKGHAVAVVPTDFDNRRDVDLLVVNYGAEPTLFRNLRDRTFIDVAAEIGLNKKGNWSGVAVGDFNKDTFVDFFFSQTDGAGIFAESDGKGRFHLKPAPATNVTAAQFLDYDSDGLLDLVTINNRGLEVFRNLGNDWQAEPKAVGLSRNQQDSVKNSRLLLSADPDEDGDLDLFARTAVGEFQLFRNQNNTGNHAELFDLEGLVSNRTGVGSKIDLRSGSLAQKLESYAASPMPAPSAIHFGLGKREKPDAVRIIWPSGIVQAETAFPDNSQAKMLTPDPIKELDRKPSSCPYLFTWNGVEFEFITDFLGGGEMGNWASEGVYHYPDSDEYIRIPPEKLKPKNGRYELRITNELEEVLYLDKVELVAVEHFAGEDIYPNEGLGIPTAGKELIYTGRNSAPPLSAVDGYGRDVLEKIEKLDRKFYDTFRSLNIRGYAEEHSLTLDLDDKKGYNGRTLLFLTGWTDYAFSSDNLAASQSGRSLFLPKLQVKDKAGEWQTVFESIGISIGRPQTLTVDLTGKFLSDSREVRIVTNFKTYWDRIAVDTSADNSKELKISRLQPAETLLRERGFSAEVRFPDNPMIAADYQTVENFDKWKYFTGSFTRTGDVLELLEKVDDNFVIAKTGDEIVLSFPELPAPPPGKTYTFLLFADGYSKEMDINSGSPDVVFPLPFKKMTAYPYNPSVEHYPMTEERLRLFEKYNTRRVFSQLPLLTGRNYKP